MSQMIENSYRASRVTVLLGVLVSVLFVYATPARATMVHKLLTSFGSEGSGAGQFKAPAGVAVNGSSGLSPAAGDVYVVDTGNHRVERFSASGVYLGQFDGSGTFEVEGKVESGTAAPTGVMSTPLEVAVDNSGNGLDPSKEDVYVVDQSHGVIDKFTATGEYVGQITGSEAASGPFEGGEGSNRSIKGVAVAPSGAVWVSIKNGPLYEFSGGLENRLVAEVKTKFEKATAGIGVDAENVYFSRNNGFFVKVNDAGETLVNPFGGAGNSYRVAVDPAGREVYLDTRVSIEAFDPAGSPIESSQSGAKAPSFGAGLFTFSAGVGVNPGNGTVYATDQSMGKVFVFEGIILPSVTLSPVSDQQPRSLTLNGIVNPEGRPVTKCVFEYATANEYNASETYGSSAPCTPASLGSGSSPVSVSAHLAGLAAETEYDYRLVAESAAGVPIQTSNESVFTGPRLSGAFAGSVSPGSTAGSASVTVNAMLDPNGADTHYYVQYGTSLAYGSYAPVDPPGVDAGSIAGAQPVSVHIGGLQAGTAYHYRFLVVQAGETFGENGPDLMFRTPRTGEAQGVADGRAWELVSPADKKGAYIAPAEAGGAVQAAQDGSGVAYVSQGSHVGEGPAGHNSYTPDLSVRRNGVWQTIDLTLPARLPEDGEAAVGISSHRFEYTVFSPDLSLALIEPQVGGTPPLAPGVTERTLYLRNDGSGAFTPLVTPANVFPPGRNIEEPAPDTNFEMHVLAASPDLKHVVFKSTLALTEDAIQEETLEKHVPNKIQWNLYEWSEGHLQLVNVLPDGSAAHGEFPKYPQVRLAGMVDINGLGLGGAQRELSADGRWVAWTWGEPYQGEEAARYRGLFVRDTVEGVTLRVGGPKAFYQTMSSDGSRVFYLENGDLYVFDTGTLETADLTGAHGAGESGEVQEAVSDVSEDGKYVYFVAKHVLAVGAVDGEYNLYLAHEAGGEWTIVHVATLAERDKPSWYASEFFAPFPAGIASRVSTVGRYLVFMSERPLTGYDNTDAVSGEADEEVFVYDAVRDHLACVTCDPTGARPRGVLDAPASELLADRHGVWTQKRSVEGDVHWDHWLAGNVPGWTDRAAEPAMYQPRYLLDDGRVFFNSPVGLVPGDTNGLEDVYEFEPAGVGGCVVGGPGYSDVTDGCVGLISSGTSSGESVFYDASESGNDVFFATASKLVGEDYDKGYDLYDAHVCTSVVPCVPEVVGSPPCSSGDSCKGAPGPQPTIFGEAPSATFSGVGNVSSSPPAGGVKARPLTSAQKKARALRACHKKRGRPRRACERLVRKRFASKGAHKANSKRKGGGR